MGLKADLMKTRIIKCARQEFLAAGFHDASLRKIASAAGVTTGAIYRHFTDKQALFSEVTDNAVNALLLKYTAMNERAMLEAGQGISYNECIGKANISELYSLVYEYYEEFYLLLMYQNGTNATSFLNKIVEMEERNIINYFEELTQHNHIEDQLDQVALHLLVKAYISALFEPIRHKMDKNEAIYHGQKMSEYLAIGWMGIEKILKNS